MSVLLVKRNVLNDKGDAIQRLVLGAIWGVCEEISQLVRSVLKGIGINLIIFVELYSYNYKLMQVGYVI